MEDPEQQDSDEDVEPDDAEAEATSSVRPFVHPLLRNYDPLGPLRAQMTDINRMLRNPVLDAMARNNAMIAAAAAAAVKPPPLNIFSPEQVAAITGPSVAAKGLLDAVAAITAQQRSMVDSALAVAAGPTLSMLNSVRPFERNWVSSYASPLHGFVLQADSFQSSLNQIASTIGHFFTCSAGSTRYVGCSGSGCPATCATSTPGCGCGCCASVRRTEPAWPGLRALRSSQSSWRYAAPRIGSTA